MHVHHALARGSCTSALDEAMEEQPSLLEAGSITAQAEVRHARLSAGQPALSKVTMAATRPRTASVRRS